MATDVASKGLDFPDIQHVINYDMPDGAPALRVRRKICSAGTRIVSMKESFPVSASICMRINHPGLVSRA